MPKINIPTPKAIVKIARIKIAFKLLSFVSISVVSGSNKSADSSPLRTFSLAARNNLLIIIYSLMKFSD